MDPSFGRPLILARPVAITSGGSLNVQDDNVVLVRSDSGQLQHYRADILNVGDGIEIHEPSTSSQRHLIPEEDDEDPIFEDALELEVDSGSETDDEEFQELNEADLLAFLQEEDEDEEGVAPDEYVWDDNYESFTGLKEEFNERAGPRIEGTSPMDLFLQIWDQSVMSTIVDQTNLYAWQTIAAASETGISAGSRLNDWVEVSAADIYRLLSVFILMGICYRARIDEYWKAGVMEMSSFRKIMTLRRFWLLMRFLHFVDNQTITPMTRGHEKKVAKISPILQHLNSKFASIYTPRRELSIDESLLLWKGRLSWVQCIRTKAARFGVKTYELCEAATGYCLHISIYTGKDSSASAPVMGFTASSWRHLLSSS